MCSNPYPGSANKNGMIQGAIRASPQIESPVFFFGDFFHLNPANICICFIKIIFGHLLPALFTDSASGGVCSAKLFQTFNEIIIRFLLFFIFTLF